MHVHAACEWQRTRATRLAGARAGWVPCTDAGQRSSRAVRHWWRRHRAPRKVQQRGLTAAHTLPNTCTESWHLSAAALNRHLTTNTWDWTLVYRLCGQHQQNYIHTKFSKKKKHGLSLWKKTVVSLKAHSALKSRPMLPDDTGANKLYWSMTYITYINNARKHYELSNLYP